MGLGTRGFQSGHILSAQTPAQGMEPEPDPGPDPQLELTPSPELASPEVVVSSSPSLEAP